MARKQPSFSDQLRTAIDGSGLTRYRICKEAGIDEASMSRFMNGTMGFSIDALDRIGEVIGLEVKARGPAKPRKGK
ncbi:MAG: hypothetical protein CMJ49_06550 [Planctomycetaceae bacterium]|nr:hypothetical protein [Planctomycetaceae bacterium]